MVINLTTLQGKAAKVVVEYMGQACNVVYDPTKLTGEWVQRSKGSDEDFAVCFSEIIRSWDIQKSGKKVPLTKAGLSSIPVPLLRAVYDAMVFGSAKNVEEEGKASSDG